MKLLPVFFLLLVVCNLGLSKEDVAKCSQGLLSFDCGVCHTYKVLVKGPIRKTSKRIGVLEKRTIQIEADECHQYPWVLCQKSAKITLAPNDFDGLDEVIAPTDYTFKCLDEKDVTQCNVVAKCKTEGNGRASWKFDIPDEVKWNFSK